MNSKISARTFFFALAMLCIGLLIGAAYMQYGPEKRQPCPLCILQRYAFLAIAIVSIMAAIHGPKKIGTLVYAGFAVICGLFGEGIAIWQVMKGSSMTSCLADPVGDFVNGLPTANWWPQYFFANGGCADKIAPIFGIAIPVWSLIWLSVITTAITALAVLALRKGR